MLNNVFEPSVRTIVYVGRGHLAILQGWCAEPKCILGKPCFVNSAEVDWSVGAFPGPNTGTPRL